MMEQLFQTLAEDLPERGDFRRRAWRLHKSLGWPNRKTESWRYTSCASLLRQPLALTTVTALNSTELAHVARWSEQFTVISLKNGVLVEAPAVSGVEVRSLRWEDLNAVNPQWIDGFAPAMVAAAQTGLFLSIDEQCSVERPLLLAYFFDGTNALSSHISLVQLGTGARASLAEVWSGEGSGLNTSQTFVSLAGSAHLKHVRLIRSQQDLNHFDDCQTQLQSNAQLDLLSVHLGSAWSRSSLLATLKDEHAKACLSGISFGLNQQHIDQRVEVRHLAPHTQSRQLFKGVWRDQARGVLNGKIYIAPRAQRVDSSQLNHNLLLSPRAEAYTKPELEVYADDVKANHGASVGRMDDEKLFYFLSRGISRSTAVQLLAEGFITDVVMKLHNEQLQNWVLSEIREVLPQYASGLEGTES